MHVHVQLCRGIPALLSSPPTSEIREVILLQGLDTRLKWEVSLTRLEFLYILVHGNGCLWKYTYFV